MRFYYSNLRSKLCFGYEENGQYDLAAQVGQECLSITPKDIWCVHAMSHVFEESNRPKEGLAFLAEREGDWADNANLDRHVWWHRALHHIQLGQQEEALSVYDEKVKPLALKSK